MKILLLSTDTRIFDIESKEHAEILRYSEETEMLHVIVLSKETKPYTVKKISEKLFIYPTNSSSRLSFYRDVLKIVKLHILWKSKISVDLIFAQDSLWASLSAYFLSKRYKKNYVVDVFENNFLFYDSENIFFHSLHTKILDKVYSRATGIRVLAQFRGEMLSAHNPLLEKKIYVLPLIFKRHQTSPVPEATHDVDIRKKFPEFNLTLFSIQDSTSITDLQRIKSIMKNLRERYPRMGLVLVTRVQHSLWHPFFVRNLPDYIKVLEHTEENTSYIRTATIYIDTQKHQKHVDNLIRAIHAGCPVIVSKTTENARVVTDGQNGFIVDSHKKPNLFVRKVIEILETPGLRQSMKMNQYDITELYGTNPDDYYKRLLSIWEACKSPSDGVSEPEPAKITEQPEVIEQVEYSEPVEIEKVPEPILNANIDVEPEEIEVEELPPPSIPMTSPVLDEHVTILSEPVETSPYFTPPPSPAPVPIARELPNEKLYNLQQPDYYPAFTLDTIKKVFKRFEKHTRKKVVVPAKRITLDNEIFDVDSVRIGIKQALDEITSGAEFEPEEDRSVNIVV